jgi:hypothetical protein
MFEVRLAVVGTVLIVVGLALWSLAAALVIAGLEMLAASYVTAYVAASRGEGIRR